MGERGGIPALFVGTSAAVLKIIPKYVTAIAVKDMMEHWLPPAQLESCGGYGSHVRSAKKSVTAGIAGAVLTNPLDVLRNEMFKTEESLVGTFRRLCREEGQRWLYRGWEKNMVSVAVPIAGTIFLTDVFAARMR